MKFSSSEKVSPSNIIQLFCILITISSTVNGHGPEKNILDLNLGLDFNHFEVDVNSERGKDVISSLLNDPNQISLDDHFTNYNEKLSTP